MLKNVTLLLRGWGVLSINVNISECCRESSVTVPSNGHIVCVIVVTLFKHISNHLLFCLIYRQSHRKKQLVAKMCQDFQK